MNMDEVKQQMDEAFEREKEENQQDNNVSAFCQVLVEVFNEYKEKAEKYDEIIAKRKAHAKKMLAGKSKEWLHERAVKANKASQEKRCKK